MKVILFIALIVILGCVVASFGQEPANSKPRSAPIAWTEYRIPSQRASVSLPKLPVMRDALDRCAQSKGAVYHAYAAGVVYEFEWHAKSDKSIPDWCPTKAKFSKATFTKRLDELKSANKDYVESDASVAGIPASMLRRVSPHGIVKTHWLLWDKDRWFELAITRRTETVVDEKRFVDGLNLSGSRGIDIGDGADATLGDADVDLKSDAVGTKREGMVLVMKPRPGYTDVARQNNTQGTVILRIFLYRNGAIGIISVLKELPDGLTEQAIAAAKKIAFLPATADGKPYNVAKQIEYTFSIY